MAYSRCRSGLRRRWRRLFFTLSTVRFWAGFTACSHQTEFGRQLFPLNGILFRIGAWILMMVLVMPMAGAGLFGMALGIMVPIATLVLHLIYGAVLGGTYGLEHPDPLPQFQVTHR